MRTVIDANCLQSPRLEHYLSSNIHNVAVLTDYAAMEAYKGNTLKSIFKSMSILSKYPNQVIILKDTQTVCGLKAKGKGLQKRLIDKSQTSGFPGYCQDLKRAEKNDIEIKQQLLRHGEAANEQMSRVLNDSKGIIKAIGDTENVYTHDELQILRKKKSLSPIMAEKIVKQILELSALLFSGHPKASSIPSFNELHNSFIFRYSLCIYLLTLDWISEGGAKHARPERIRNDVIDMNYVAFATYFNGLMTHDKKAAHIYEEAMIVLRIIFEI